MTVLTGSIPKSNFQSLLKRIAEILKSELDAQTQLYSERAVKNIYVERVADALAYTEVPALNIQIAQGEYNTRSRVHQDGNYLFNIDVYEKAEETGDTQGDELAAIRLFNLINRVRYILMHPQYDTLGFDSVTMRRSFEAFQVDDRRSNENDTEFVKMARCNFRVEAPEHVELANAVLADGMETEVKLEETDVGYKWSDDY